MAATPPDQPTSAPSRRVTPPDGDDGDIGLVRIRTNTVTGPAPVAGSPDRIWDRIRTQRLAAGLGIRDIALRAHVNELNVEAIEAGAIERLPYGDMGRREVTAVCTVLDLDPQPFTDALRDGQRATGVRFDPPRPGRRRRRLVIVGLIWVVLFAIVVGSQFFGLIGRDGADVTGGSETTTTVTTATTAPPAPTTTEAPPTTEAPTTTTAPPTTQPNHVVQITAVGGRTNVTAKIDGAAAFSGPLAKGESKEFRGTSVVVTVGKPSLVQVLVDGAAAAPGATIRVG